MNHDLPAHIEEEIRFEEGFYLAIRLREEDMCCPSCGQKGKLFDFCKEEKLSTGEMVENRGFTCGNCDREWYCVDGFLTVETDKAVRSGQMPSWCRFARKETPEGGFIGATVVALH